MKEYKKTLKKEKEFDLEGLDLKVVEQLDLLNRKGRTVHQFGINEKTAASAVLGTQYAPSGDVDAFWYGKAHGAMWVPDEVWLANLAGGVPFHDYAGSVATMRKSETRPARAHANLASVLPLLRMRYSSVPSFAVPDISALPASRHLCLFHLCGTAPITS